MWPGLSGPVSPSLAIDGAVRVGRHDEALEGHVNLLELRLGLTWSFPVFRHDEREPWSVPRRNVIFCGRRSLG